MARWIGQSSDTDQFITNIKQKRRKGKSCFTSESSRFRSGQSPADFAKATAITLVPEGDVRRRGRDRCPAPGQATRKANKMQGGGSGGRVAAHVREPTEKWEIKEIDFIPKQSNPTELTGNYRWRHSLATVCAERPGMQLQLTRIAVASLGWCQLRLWDWGWETPFQRTNPPNNLEHLTAWVTRLLWFYLCNSHWGWGTVMSLRDGIR